MKEVLENLTAFLEARGVLGPTPCVGSHVYSDEDRTNDSSDGSASEDLDMKLDPLALLDFNTSLSDGDDF